MRKLSQYQILKFLLYAGAVYFAGVTLAHAVGVKIPGLFVFYNVPSYAYQDRIISFLALGWATFFFQAARTMNPDQIRTILFIGLVAIIALVLNIAVTDFIELDPSIRDSDFMWIVGGLVFYWLGLVVQSRALVFQKK